MKRQTVRTFESLVNSRRCKTDIWCGIVGLCLRALLIQEGVKRGCGGRYQLCGLRALLIQEGVKQDLSAMLSDKGLRALLIQEGIKP